VCVCIGCVRVSVWVRVHIYRGRRGGDTVTRQGGDAALSTDLLATVNLGVASQGEGDTHSPRRLGQTDTHRQAHGFPPARHERPGAACHMRRRIHACHMRRRIHACAARASRCSACMCLWLGLGVQVWRGVGVWVHVLAPIVRLLMRSQRSSTGAHTTC